MSLFTQVANLANGAKTLTEWLGSGGKVVDVKLAQERANVCIACDRNVKSGALTGPIADAVREQLEVKNHLRIRTWGEKKLGKCNVCDCELRLKVHVPIERIKPDDDERSRFPAYCWLITETK